MVRACKQDRSNKHNGRPEKVTFVLFNIAWKMKIEVMQGFQSTQSIHIF
jgi:hypothetical protein